MSFYERLLPVKINSVIGGINHLQTGRKPLLDHELESLGQNTLFRGRLLGRTELVPLTSRTHGLP